MLGGQEGGIRHRALWEGRWETDGGGGLEWEHDVLKSFWFLYTFQKGCVWGPRGGEGVKEIISILKTSMYYFSYLTKILISFPNLVIICCYSSFIKDNI